MSDQDKLKATLTDDDIITSPKLLRLLLIAGACVALGAATLGSHTAVAEGQDVEVLDSEGLQEVPASDEKKPASDKDAAGEGGEMLTDEGIEPLDKPSE